MKLLVLCERAGLDGGIETYLRTSIRALLRRDVEVVVAARFVDEENAFGARSVALAWSDEHDEPSAPAALRLRELLREGFDAISLHSVLDPGIVEVTRDAKTRVIYHLHDHRLFCPNGDRRYPRSGGACSIRMGNGCLWHSLIDGCVYGPRLGTERVLRRRERVRNAVHSLDAVIAFTAFMRDTAIRNGIDASRAHVLRAPIDEDALGVPVCERPHRDSVLFAGRVYKSKGILALIRALARIPPARRPLLRIAGTGPELEAALALAYRLACAVEPLGRLHSDAVYCAMDQSTILALPSCIDEPLGLVGLEAFARGRPVAAFASGGIPQWIGEGGLLVSRGDETALAGAIETLLQEREWKTRSKAARAIAERHTMDAHIDELMAAYAFHA